MTDGLRTLGSLYVQWKWIMPLTHSTFSYCLQDTTCTLLFECFCSQFLPSSNPLQYSCLENAVDRGAWWAAVHGVAQSRTRLKQLSMHAYIGEEMATHSSVLAWRISGSVEPGGLPSMGLHRVGHG